MDAIVPFHETGRLQRPFLGLCFGVFDALVALLAKPFYEDMIEGLLRTLSKPSKTVGIYKAFNDITMGRA